VFAFGLNSLINNEADPGNPAKVVDIDIRELNRFIKLKTITAIYVVVFFFNYNANDFNSTKYS